MTAINVSAGSNRVHRSVSRNSFGQHVPLCGGISAHRLYQIDTEANCKGCDKVFHAQQAAAAEIARQDAAKPAVTEATAAHEALIAGARKVAKLEDNPHYTVGQLGSALAIFVKQVEKLTGLTGQAARTRATELAIAQRGYADVVRQAQRCAQIERDNNGREGQLSEAFNKLMAMGLEEGLIPVGMSDMGWATRFVDEHRI